MARSHLRGVLIDPGTGVVVAGQAVNVYRPGTTTPPIGDMLNASTGGSVVTNPRTSDASGVVEIWLEYPQAVDMVYVDGVGTHRITVQSDSVTTQLTEVWYCAPWGDNSNDGKSFDTPKLDIWGAYDVMEQDGATIYFADNTYVDDANHDRGLWLMYERDPQWNGGAMIPGWRTIKGFNLIGVGHGPGTQLLGPGWRHKSRLLGAGDDPLKPAVWLSQHGTGTTFQNILFDTNAAVSVRLGIASDLSATVDSGCLQFTDCDFPTNRNFATAGPAVEIGYSFWDRFEQCTFDAGTTDTTPVLSITNIGLETYRYDIGLDPRMRIDDLVSIQGVATAGYNGTFAVRGVGSTFVDVNIAATPGATGSLAASGMSHARSYRRAAIGHDVQTVYPDAWDVPAPNAPNNAGPWYIKDCIFRGGGVHTAWNNSTQAGSVMMDNCLIEGGPTWTPPLYHMRLEGGQNSTTALQVTNVIITGGAIADSIGSDPLVMVDGERVINPGAVVIMNSIGTGGEGVSFGPCTRLGGYYQSEFDKRSHTVGTVGNFLGGTIDTSRRAFSPNVARYINLAPQDTSVWGATSGTATVTTGKASPDGLTNAAEFSAPSGPTLDKQIYRNNQNYGLNDWIVCGAWMRGGSTAATIPTFAESGSAGFAMTAGGTGFSCEKRTPVRDDGWEWVYGYGKVAAIGATSPAEFIFSLRVAGGDTVEYAYPIAMRIPASVAFVDEEGNLTGIHLSTWADTANIGDVSLLTGQSLHIPKGHIEAIEVADPPAPAANRGRMYFRDNGSGKTQLVARFPTGAVQVIATQP